MKKLRPYFSIALFALFLAPAASHAQVMIPASDEQTSDELFPAAKVTQSVMAQLDQARRITIMDATPTGSNWFIVDVFANSYSINLNGSRFPIEYHAIPNTGTKLSPNGDYIIWTGLTRGMTWLGFDSTVAEIYKDTTFIGRFVGDYPAVDFSRSGQHWALSLPFAYYNQPEDHDFVIVDGKVVAKNATSPHQFSFSHDEQSWAYRATDGRREKLITSDGQNVTLYTRPPDNQKSLWDATIWRYTPDVSVRGKLLEGRDYEINFANIARQSRTAYSSRNADTARTYLSWKGRNEGLYRWITNVLIDTAGKHLAYFACDPMITHLDSSQNERAGVVVYDGKIVAGPYPGVLRLFLSPSGEHYAYSLRKESRAFYVDKKLTAKTSQIMDVVWSPDEKKIAFMAVGRNDKVYVVANGKRSPLFEQIGRIAFDATGKFVEYVGVQNGKLIKVRQPA